MRHILLSDNCNMWSFLTFIGHLEAEGAAGVICFEIEPHLVTGADYEVWSCGTREAARGDKRTRFLEEFSFIFSYYRIVIIKSSIVYFIVLQNC